MQESWLERLRQPRRDSVARELIASLPAQPVIDVAAGRQLTGKSHVAIRNALHALEQAGVLQRLNEKKWGQLWECGALIDLVSKLETEMSAPPPASIERS